MAAVRRSTPEKQAQRIQAAADVLKKLNPDILLLQEVRDYDTCARLGDAIQPGAYTVGICCTIEDDSGKTLPVQSRAVEVLRRQLDGSWKLIMGDPNGRE